MVPWNLPLVDSSSIGIMPPKMKGTKIGSVEPTADELEAARKVLADATAGGRRSKNASFIHFLKTNPDCGNEDAASAKGLARDAYLEKFLVLQMRYSKAERTCKATREISSSHRKLKDLHWWSMEQMDINMGAQKGKHWRDSKLLPDRADSLTGSLDPNFIEYGVPHDWQQLSHDDFSRLTFEATTSGHTVEEFNKAVEMYKDPEAVGVQEGVQKNEVQAKGTQDDGGGLKIDEMKSAVKKFLELERRKFQLAKYQEYEIAIMMWLAKYAASQKKSSTSKYASDLAEDLQKHKKEVGRISAHMMKLACADAEDLYENKIPQLLE